MQIIQEVKLDSSWPSLAKSAAESVGDSAIDGILHGIGCDDDGIVCLSIRSFNFPFEKDLDRQLYDRLMFRVVGVLVDLEEFDFILT